MFCPFKKELYVFPKDETIWVILPLEIRVVSIDKYQGVLWSWAVLWAKAPRSLSIFWFLEELLVLSLNVRMTTREAPTASHGHQDFASSPAELLLGWLQEKQIRSTHRLSVLALWRIQVLPESGSNYSSKWPGLKQGQVLHLCPPMIRAVVYKHSVLNTFSGQPRPFWQHTAGCFPRALVRPLSFPPPCLLSQWPCWWSNGTTTMGAPIALQGMRRSGRCGFATCHHTTLTQPLSRPKAIRWSASSFPSSFQNPSKLLHLSRDTVKPLSHIWNSFPVRTSLPCHVLKPNSAVLGSGWNPESQRHWKIGQTFWKDT